MNNVRWRETLKERSQRVEREPEKEDLGHNKVIRMLQEEYKNEEEDNMKQGE